MNRRNLITDAELLDWTAKRAAGVDPRDIDPQRYETVRSATNRVRLDDLRMSGEPENTVKEGYWA